MTAKAPLTRRQLREAARSAAAEAPAVEAPSAEALPAEDAPAALADSPAEAAVDAVASPAADGGHEASAEASREDAAGDVPKADPESAADADAFAAAAKALNFTGTAPVAATRASRARRTPSRDAVAAGSRARRWVTPVIASMSGAAVIGMLALGLASPLGAIATADGATLTASAELAAESAAGEEEEIQAFVAADDAQAPELDRVDDYSTVKIADLAAAAGIRTSNAFFVNDPTADIQYPFAVGTSMSYGYGMRSGRLHEGIDFTPGEGAPVQSIADGTVRVATESGGAYGVSVYIDHVIDGEAITSHYAHMEYGSLRVQAGDKVEVGDVIGQTGNTGRSFGAHTHFELLRGGATFDPQPWLEEHAGTHFSDDD